jgi:hypothetical protein
MGVFTKLFKPLRPLQVDDEFFGRLTYMKMPEGRISYWEASREFSHSEEGIEVFIDAPAPEAVPSTDQREFFLTVEREFEKLRRNAARVIQPELERILRRPMGEVPSQDLRISSLSIPNSPLLKAEWDASFELESDPNHLFTVTFKGTDATGVEVSG